MKIVLGLLVLVAGLAAAVGLHGRAETWELIFGPADQGPVDFATLSRGSRPNDALACPPDLCPASARPDLTPPVYAVPTKALAAALHAAVSLEPLIDRVAQSETDLTSRYVQRSALMRFPDTIVAKAIPVDARHSTLALYSRSQIGYSDLGVNKARLERWISLLDALPKRR